MLYLDIEEYIGEEAETQWALSLMQDEMYDFIPSQMNNTKG